MLLKINVGEMFTFGLAIILMKIKGGELLEARPRMARPHFSCF